MFEFSWLTADLATRICLTLLHSLWQIALLAMIASAVGRWRRNDVNRSYSAHVAALLVGMLLIPVTFCCVDNPLKDNENITTGAVIEEPLIVVSPINDSPDLPAAIVKKEIQLVEAPASGQAHLRQSQPHPEDIDATETSSTRFANTSWDETKRSTNWWPSLAIGGIAVYAIGVILMILRLVLLLVRTDRIANNAVAIESGPAFELLNGLAKKWRMKIVPSLMLAEQTITPKVVGLIQPMILLPASAISGLTPNELEMILAHELAHVRRYDLWVNLVQRVAEALLFFNPAIWYLSRRISTIREYCCDELACEAIPGQPDETRARYANALVRVVELANTNDAEQVAQITALAATGRSPSELRQRVARLFGEPLREPLRLSRRGLAIIAAVVVAFFVSPFIWDLAAAIPPANQPTASLAEEDSPSVESQSFTLLGQVIDADGKAVANARVEARCLPQEAGAVKRQAEADDSGNFAIVIDGDPETHRHWDFTAKSNSGDQIGFSHHFYRGEKTNVARLEIEVKPAKFSTIQVLDAESKPVVNASVGAMCDHGAWISQKLETDGNGRATVVVPKSFRIESVIAWKDGVGFDYQTYTLRRNQRADLKTQLPEFPVEGETLRLEGTDPVTIQLADDARAPIQGARLSPMGFRKASASERQDLNLLMFKRLISQATDATGHITFNWMPKWQKSQVLFVGRARVGYEPGRSAERHLKITLNRKVSIRGRVLDEAGNPAAGIAVAARGTGYGYPKDVGASTKSADDGSYEMSVMPEHLYMVLAHDDDRVVSDKIPSFVVKPGKPVEGVDLQLRKPTRVTGQLKSESSGKPIGEQTVSVYQYGDDLNSMKGVTLANPKKVWYSRLRPRYLRKVSTAPEGRFELLLGDGSYEIRPPGGFMGKEFQISGEDMISVDVISKQEVTAAHSKKANKVTLTGTVRHYEDNRPMPNIRVVGVPRNSDRDWQARTDANGEFAVEVVSDEVYLHAATEDKSLGAIAKLEAGQNTTNLVLRRTGSAHGVLLQSDSDTPAANQVIKGGIKITSEEPVSYRWTFGGRPATDSDGKFSIKGVVPGWDYELVLLNRLDGSTPQVATVKVEPGQNTDLGKLTIPALRKRYVPPTLDERIGR